MIDLCPDQVVQLSVAPLMALAEQKLQLADLCLHHCLAFLQGPLAVALVLLAVHGAELSDHLVSSR